MRLRKLRRKTRLPRCKSFLSCSLGFNRLLPQRQRQHQAPKQQNVGMKWISGHLIISSLFIMELVSHVDAQAGSDATNATTKWTMPAVKASAATHVDMMTIPRTNLSA